MQGSKPSAPASQSTGWLRETPMLRVLIPFVIGLAACPFLAEEHFPAEATCYAAVLLFAAGTRYSPLVRAYPLRWWSGLFAAIACLVLGITLGLNEQLLRQGHADAAANSISWKGTCLVKTLQTPNFSGNGSPWASVQARVLSQGPSPGKKLAPAFALNGQKILLSVKGMDTLLPGSTLLCALAVERPSKASHPVDFDQRAYLASQSVYWQARLDSSQYQVWEEGHGLREAVQRLRTHSLNALERSVPDAQAGAVLSALSLGWKEELDQESLLAFSRAGTLHILAVSGMHVGLVYVLLQKLVSFLLARLRKPIWKRWGEGVLAIGGVWLFVLLSGAPPSAMRAGLLFSLMALSRLVHRKGGGKNAWASTAFLLLLLQPSLLYSVGFQLSFSAVAGILWTYAWFRQRLVMKGWLGKHLGDLLALSLAAQLGCLSLSWYYFGQFPVHFLLGNLVGVPLVGFFLFCSAILIAVPSCLLTHALGQILVCLVHGWLDAMERVGNLPGALMSLPQLPAMATLAMFVSIIWWFSLNQDERQNRLPGRGAALMLLMALVWAAYRAEHRHRGEWLVANCRADHCRLEIVAGGKILPILGQTGPPSKAARWRGAKIPAFNRNNPQDGAPATVYGHPEYGLLPLQFGPYLIQRFTGQEEQPFPNQGVVLVQDGWPPRQDELTTTQDSVWYGKSPGQILLVPTLTKRQRQVWLSWCRMQLLPCEVLPKYGSREWRLTLKP